MKKRIPWVIAIILVLTGGFFGYRWYNRRASLRAAVADFRTNVASAKVERRDLEVSVTGNGTVQATLKKNVQPGVAGKVTRVLVKEGDLVAGGSPLLVLSNDSISYQAEQARLDLALAQQALANLTGPAGSRASSELALKQAELDLSTAEDRLKALLVESSLEGEVWAVNVKPGDPVKAGQTVIATVGDTGAFTVTTKVRQADITKFRTGVAVSIFPGGELPAVTGEVTSVGREGTTGSKGVEFPVTITISDPHPDLRSGMSVNVNYTADDGTTFSLPSTISARDRRDVKSEVDGTVCAVLVAEGDRVEDGQVMVRLENRSLEVALDKAVTAVETAKQNLSSYENAIEQQKLKVEQARIAAADRAESAARLTVRSSISGRVVSISVQEGDDVNANQNLVTVSQVSPLTVVIPVDELDIGNVAIGQPVRVEVDALPGETFPGSVLKIAQEGAVQQGITNYNVTIELTSDAPRLGMSATATISIARKENVLTIPVEALKWDRGQAYVNQMEDGQVVQKRVKIGVESDLYAEVVSGLSEGETILVGNIPASGIGAGLGGLRMPNQVPRVNLPGGAQARPR